MSFSASLEAYKNDIRQNWIVATCSRITSDKHAIKICLVVMERCIFLRTT